MPAQGGREKSISAFVLRRKCFADSSGYLIGGGGIEARETEETFLINAIPDGVINSGPRKGISDIEGLGLPRTLSANDELELIERVWKGNGGEAIDASSISSRGPRILGNRSL